MLKQYQWKGKQWQFEEGKQPKDAIEIAEPREKEKEKPANKARKVKNK